LLFVSAQRGLSHRRAGLHLDVISLKWRVSRSIPQAPGHRREQQQRRNALEVEQQELTQLEHDAAIDDARLAVVGATAADFRAALAERTSQARRVLQALLLESSPRSSALA
jgi:hypothetical protein